MASLPSGARKDADAPAMGARSANGNSSSSPVLADVLLRALVALAGVLAAYGVHADISTQTMEMETIEVLAANMSAPCRAKRVWASGP